MGWELLILLRPQILLFFLLGILTRRLALDGRATAVPTLPLALLFLSLAAPKVALAASGNDYETSRPALSPLLDRVFRLSSDERRVGQARVSTCRYRWWPY